MNQRDLTQSRLKELFNYDENTGVFTRRVSRGGNVAGSVAAGAGMNGSTHISIDKVRYQAHRLAWLYVYGRFPYNDIDHINGVRNDNRIINLRDVTPSENARNRKLPINSASSVIGVRWHKPSRKWQARIKTNHKEVHLGLFNDFSDACHARRAAESRYNFHPNHGRQ